MITGEIWSESTLWRRLCSDDIGYSLQVTTDQAIQEEEEVKEFLEALRTLVVDPAQLIFIDESQKDRKSSRRRSWARRNHTPFNSGYFAGSHGKRYTLVAACDINGFIIDACETVERETGSLDNDLARGTVDGDRFKLWVEEKLVKVLGKYSEGAVRSVVTMDNAIVHHVDGIVEAIKNKGRAKVIFTAPYSPEYNPIEAMFHLYKMALRRHRGAIWTHAHLQGLMAVTPQHARALFRHAQVPGCSHFPTTATTATNEQQEEMCAALASLATAIYTKTRQT